MTRVLEFLAITLAAAAILACQPPAPVAEPDAEASVVAAMPLPSPTSCKMQGQLPDKSCTPGVVNPNVTQENIAATICKSGWTATIRPSVSYTNALKRRQMIAYGLTGSPSDFEEDHLISLELGGDPRDPRNLFPEPWPDARKKDVIETRLNREVCNHTITLAQGQAMILDWTAVR